MNRLTILVNRCLLFFFGWVGDRTSRTPGVESRHSSRSQPRLICRTQLQVFFGELVVRSLLLRAGPKRKARRHYCYHRCVLVVTKKSCSRRVGVHAWRQSVYHDRRWSFRRTHLPKYHRGSERKASRANSQTAHQSIPHRALGSRLDRFVAAVATHDKTLCYVMRRADSQVRENLVPDKAGEGEPNVFHSLPQK
jgi:hypothetical protein